MNTIATVAVARRPRRPPADRGRPAGCGTRPGIRRRRWPAARRRSRRAGPGAACSSDRQPLLDRRQPESTETNGSQSSSCSTTLVGACRPRPTSTPASMLASRPGTPSAAGPPPRHAGPARRRRRPPSPGGARGGRSGRRVTGPTGRSAISVAAFCTASPTALTRSDHARAPARGDVVVERDHPVVLDGGELGPAGALGHGVPGLPAALGVGQEDQVRVGLGDELGRQLGYCLRASGALSAMLVRPNSP